MIEIHIAVLMVALGSFLVGVGLGIVKGKR